MTAMMGTGETPSDEMVARVMFAATEKHPDASEEKVVRLLAFKHDECGIRPGTFTAPNTWSWFETTVFDHFAKRESMEYESYRSDYHYWQPRTETRRLNEQAPAGMIWDARYGRYTPTHAQPTLFDQMGLLTASVR